MGSIHSVSAVVPMLKSRWTNQKVAETVVGAVSAETTEGADDSWIPAADLSHLDDRQKEMVMKVLIEEREVFSRSELDIGDIKDFHMKIKLSDDTPVKEAYRKIPRKLEISSMICC